MLRPAAPYALGLAVAWICCELCFVGSSLALAVDAPQPDEFQITTLVDEKDFVIRAAHLPKVHFGRLDWLRFELENKTGEPLHIESMRTRIRAECYRLDDGTPYPNAKYDTPIHGPTAFTLIRGRDYVANEPHRVFLPPHEKRSDSACFPAQIIASYLPDPPPCGLRVEGAWWLDIQFVGGRTVELKEGVHTIKFDWRAPNAKELVAINSETRRLLNLEQPRQYERALCAKFLLSPATSATVTLADVASALRTARAQKTGAGHICRFAGERYRGKPEVVEEVRELIRAKDMWIADQLKTDDNLWHPSYVRDLVLSCIPYDPGQRSALQLLGRRSSQWRDQWQLSAMLSVEVKRYWREPFTKPLSELPEHLTWQWVQAVADLSHTNDLDNIELIAVGLDDKRRIPLDPNTNQHTLAKRIPPLRNCDAALDSILRLLDGPIEPVYQALGLHNPSGADVDFATLQKRFDEARDKMIAALKTRLAERAQAGRR